MGARPMPRRRPTQAQIDIIVARFTSHRGITAIAREVGLHPDTVRRILARQGVCTFEGAKYEPTIRTKTWHRPCLVCRSTAERPKWQFLCSRCSPD